MYLSLITIIIYIYLSLYIVLIFNNVETIAQSDLNNDTHMIRRRNRKPFVEFNVLVLGGAGFIGFSLVRKLSRLPWITRIVCVDDLTPYYPIKLKYDRIDLLLRNPKISFEYIDIINDSNIFERILKEKNFQSIVYLAHYPRLDNKCMKLEHKNRLDSTYAFFQFMNTISQYYQELQWSHTNTMTNKDIPKIMYISSTISYNEIRKYKYLQKHPLKSYLAELVNPLSTHIPINEAITQSFHLKYNLPSIGFRLPSIIVGPWNHPSSWLEINIDKANVRTELYGNDIILPGDLIGNRFKCDRVSSLSAIGSSSYKTAIYIEDIINAMILSLNHTSIRQHHQQQQLLQLQKKKKMPMTEENRLRVIEVQLPIETPRKHVSKFLRNYTNHNTIENIANYRFHYLTNIQNIQENLKITDGDNSETMVQTYQAQITFNKGIKETINWYQNYISRIWPCASECHNSTTLCHTTHWDKLIPFTKRLTDGCPMIIYTIINTFFNEQGDINNNNGDNYLPYIDEIHGSRDPINNKCVLAFIDFRSNLTNIQSNWTMILTSFQNKDDLLPKFSPTSFFAKSVKYIYYINTKLFYGKSINKDKFLNAYKLFSDFNRRAIQIAFRSTNMNNKSIRNMIYDDKKLLNDRKYDKSNQQLQHYQKYGKLFHLNFYNLYNPSIILYNLNVNSIGRLYRCNIYQEILNWKVRNEILTSSYILETMHKIIQPLDSLIEIDGREWISVGKFNHKNFGFIRILSNHSILF